MFIIVCIFIFVNVDFLMYFIPFSIWISGMLSRNSKKRQSQRCRFPIHIRFIFILYCTLSIASAFL